jgi:hypothetical protein
MFNNRIGMVPSGTSVFDSACQCIDRGRSDWDAYERSWDFQSLPLLGGQWRVVSDEKEQLITHHSSLATSYAAWITQNRHTIAEMKRL